MTESVLMAFLTGVLIIATIYDLRFRRIPNLLTFPAMGFALVCHTWSSGADGLLFALGGLALGTAFLIVPYLTGGMGAGDVKLLGAAGAALGPKGIFISALFMALFGGIYALWLLAVNYRKSKGLIARSATTLKIFAATGQFFPVSEEEKEERPRLCYGLAIALGTVFYIFLESTGFNFSLLNA